MSANLHISCLHSVIPVMVACGVVRGLDSDRIVLGNGWVKTMGSSERQREEIPTL